MKCKYKFQNPEKFDGKPYCMLFNELCKDLSFVCDKNCQVYEDNKLLQIKERKLWEHRQALTEIRKRLYIVKNDSITHHIIRTTMKGLIDYINEVLR